MNHGFTDPSRCPSGPSAAERISTERSSPAGHRPPVPSGRTVPEKQFGAFLVAATLSGEEQLVVTNQELANRTGLGTETVSEVMSFVDRASLVNKSPGKFHVTETGWAIAEMYQQDETQARLLLQEQFLACSSVTDPVIEALHDAPVPQELLAQRLQERFSCKGRRALYLLDWLVLALVVRRDSSKRISPSVALSATAGAARRSEAPAPVPEPGALMGMTNRELRALPPLQYIAVLDNVADLVSLASA
ncbi:hypothetical protein ABTZ59_33490 [Streptomyces sp. NPDC094034]|uniref:hypothetical protein n=1 Tax=Streptomyces sp. NPDC094034 TaxID=3155309 RepID=UPI00331D8B24